mmetsp:Transcript_74450/g.137303  ORF Transcript_74450/g.137303 Transcript_74450/m.137303 type:complete len:215 (-) Transcript_74450:188-832(-)
MTTGQRKLARKLAEQHLELRCESFGFGADRRLHLFKANGASDTTSSVTVSSPKPSSEAPSSPEDERCANLPCVQVRNTFIHINTGAGDERIVQSMPRSMFRQCLLEEQGSASVNKEQATTGDAQLDTSMTSVDAAMPQASGGDLLIPGTSVQIQGLVKAPAFNGLRGIVQSWDEASGRYSILIHAPTASSGYQQAKVKAENLFLVPPSCSPGGA